MKRFTILIFLTLFSINVLAIDKLEVGYYENPPKIFRDAIYDRPSGFWADVTNQIGKDAGIDIVWHFGSWDQCMEWLQTGEIDIMVDVADIESRKNTMVFTEEMVLLSWSSLFTHKKTEASSILDFQNRTIAVLSGSVNYKKEGGVIDLLESFEITYQIKEYSSYVDLLDAVAESEVFAGVASKDIGEIYVKSGRINNTPFWFQPIHLKYALSLKNDLAPEIITLLDTYISNYKNDVNSIYYKSIDKHINKKTTSYFPSWAKILVGILVLLIVIIYSFNRILSSKVRIQTEHLMKEISEKKKTQNSLISTQNKLKAINKVKDNFLRSVSHELLTPLNAILGFSNILINNHDSLSKEIKLDYIEMINSSGTKLLKIVNDMIDATLINSKLVSIRHDNIDINSFLESIFQSYPKSNKLKYNLELPDNPSGKPIILYSDKEKIIKILTHLMDNSTKFTEQGSISLGYTYDNNRITLYVKDTGIGISAEDQKMIFKDFTKLEDNHTTFREGSGLGLTIVQALVNTLKGEIWLESNLNKGSIFYVTLPLNPEE